MASTATKQHKHELSPGQVCGTCSLRAPPTKRCNQCRREVADWPADEIGFLEKQGWTLVDPYTWLEPQERVMRSPTPEMVSDATNMVGFYTAQLAHWKSDKLRREQLQTGMEKARDKLAKLKAGEKFECRPRLRLNQANAVQAEYVRTHPYDPKTQDKVVPAYTEQQHEVWESQARARRGGVLLTSDTDLLLFRKERTLTVHHTMCCECRQY